MIKMDQSEQKFFRMCRYKEINGKILVCFINDHVNSDEAKGLEVALAKKHVYCNVHPEGNLWIDKDMFYENKDSYYAGRRRCIKTSCRLSSSIVQVREGFGPPLLHRIGESDEAINCGLHQRLVPQQEAEPRQQHGQSTGDAKEHKVL